MPAATQGTKLSTPKPPNPALPTTLAFAKYHGLGNDFVVVDVRSQPLLQAWSNVDWAKVALAACNRRTGVGADGLLLLALAPPDAHADYEMRVVNSDGSDGGMCGNGIRCIAHLLFARGAASPTRPLRVLAGGSTRTVSLVGECTPHASRVQVDMGVATVFHRAQPVRSLLPDLAAELTVACGPGTTCSVVDVGNPHLVLHCERLPGDSALAVLGPRIEHHRAFPNRTNVQFVVPAHGNAVSARTWERGSGITQACGTGACAVAASLASDRPSTLDVALSGGVLTIETGAVEPCSGSSRVPSVRMTGPAVWVFDGALPMPQVHNP